MYDPDDKLTEYALGILDKKTAKTLQAEIESSVQKQSALSEIEQAITLLADAEQPLAPSAHLQARILDAVRKETRFAGFADRLSSLFDLEKSVIEKHLAALDQVTAETWQINAFPGAHLFHFNGGPGVAANADCGLVYVEPGKAIAAHRHLGEEWTFILQGQLKENNDAVYYPGDCMHRPAGSVHALQSAGKEPLIFAAMLIEGLEFVAEKEIPGLK